MVCFLAPIEASILFYLKKRTSTALGVTKKILRKAGIWFIKIPERLAPKKCCEVKKINPKISMKFSGYNY